MLYKRARITDRAKISLRGSGVGFLVLSLRMANPTNIDNANPDPPTPADRVVPIHDRCLVSDRAKGSLGGSGVGFLVLSFRMANPTNIAILYR